MTNCVRIENSQLYAGPDLGRADELSVACFPDSGSPRTRLPGRITGLIQPFLDFRWRNLLTSMCLVQGIEPQSGCELSIRYRGNSRNIHFVADNIFRGSTYDIIEDRSIARAVDPDIDVLDHPLNVLLSPPRRSFQIPQWVHQATPLGSDWATTLKRFSRSHRREIGRLLRRGRYSVRLRANRESVDWFYRDVFAPYAKSRFGGNAIIPTAEVFADKNEGSFVLELLDDAVPVGANLLYLSDSAVEIRNSGILQTAGGIGGYSDLLDYFSLLCGQLAGKSALGFGLTRPHLDDGILKYKAKWRAVVIRDHWLKNRIQVSVRRESQAVDGFIKGNRFILYENGELVAKLLVDRNKSAGRQIASILDTTQAIGLARTTVLCTDQPAATLDIGAHRGISVKSYNRDEQLLPQYLGC